jgi:hypothetical protein
VCVQRLIVHAFPREARKNWVINWVCGQSTKSLSWTRTSCTFFAYCLKKVGGDNLFIIHGHHLQCHWNCSNQLLFTKVKEWQWAMTSNLKLPCILPDTLPCLLPCRECLEVAQGNSLVGYRQGRRFLQFPCHCTKMLVITE